MISERELRQIAAKTGLGVGQSEHEYVLLCVLDALIAALALADYDRATDTLRKTFDVLSLKRF